MIYRSNTFCSLLLASAAIVCSMKQVRSKSVLRFDRKHRAANIMSSNEFGLVSGHEKSLMNIEEEASYMTRVLGDSSYSDGSKCDLSVSAKCFLLDEEKVSLFHANNYTYLHPHTYHNFDHFHKDIMQELPHLFEQRSFVAMQT